VRFPVEETLVYSPVLRDNYDIHQSSIQAMSMRDFKPLEACLAKPATALASNYMRTSVKTLRKDLPFINSGFLFILS